jgi:hypothetical protein
MTAGKIILVSGLAVALIGLVNMAVGKLPGDVVVRRGNLTLVVPIVTSLVVSLVLTLLLVFS